MTWWMFALIAIAIFVVSIVLSLTDPYMTRTRVWSIITVMWLFAALSMGASIGLAFS